LRDATVARSVARAPPNVLRVSGDRALPSSA
jgi:hypothetical protein